MVCVRGWVWVRVGFGVGLGVRVRVRVRVRVSVRGCGAFCVWRAGDLCVVSLALESCGVPFR